MNWSAGLAVLVWLHTVTLTSIVPLPAGLVATQLVAEAQLTFVAAFAPNLAGRNRIVQGCLSVHECITLRPVHRADGADLSSIDQRGDNRPQVVFVLDAPRDHQRHIDPLANSMASTKSFTVDNLTQEEG